MQKIFILLPVIACSATSLQASVVLHESFKFASSDGQAAGYLGNSIASSGGMAMVGAANDDTIADRSGAAYVFDVAAGTELRKLTAKDGAREDQFGAKVDIDGNTAIVGAPFSDPSGLSSGSVYIFDVATGAELFKLTASDGGAADEFGAHVGVSGNRAVVGAHHYDGVGSNSGAAYVFDITTGQELFKLTAFDAEATDEFGFPVAISGNTIIVGSRGDDDAGGSSGSAYLFDATTGQQLHKLTADDASAGALFGYSVAISGHLAVVGAVSGSGTEPGTGSAYVFDTVTGKQLFKLTASDGATSDKFGWSVAIDQGLAVIGARTDYHNGILSGSAYVFDALTGEELYKLTASDGAKEDNFGHDVSIYGDRVLVSAPADDDAGDSSGSLYVFNNIPEPGTSCCLSVLLAIAARHRRCRP